MPHIDTIMDSIAGHDILSFMDGFLGYNHIIINKEYQHKTTFTTPWGTLYWAVMPFGLKNARETYQRAKVTMVYDLIHKSIEFYIDDILATST